jgi:hypothetical protein
VFVCVVVGGFVGLWVCGFFVCVFGCLCVVVFVCLRVCEFGRILGI